METLRQLLYFLVAIYVKQQWEIFKLDGVKLRGSFTRVANFGEFWRNNLILTAYILPKTEHCTDHETFFAVMHCTKGSFISAIKKFGWNPTLNVMRLNHLAPCFCVISLKHDNKQFPQDRTDREDCTIVFA